MVQMSRGETPVILSRFRPDARPPTLESWCNAESRSAEPNYPRDSRSAPASIARLPVYNSRGKFTDGHMFPSFLLIVFHIHACQFSFLFFLLPYLLAWLITTLFESENKLAPLQLVPRCGYLAYSYVHLSTPRSHVNAGTGILELNYC